MTQQQQQHTQMQRCPATVFSVMVVLERRGGGYAMVPSRDVEMNEITLYESAHDSTSEDGRH